MLAGRGRMRLIFLLLSMALVAICVGLDLGGRDATTKASAATAQRRFPSLGLLLRLPDLPLGYRLLNFGPSPEFMVQPLTCDRVDPANPQSSLASFLERYSPSGCYGVYFRLFHVTGTTPASLAVGTGAMDTGSTEAAEAGLGIAPELISHLIGDTMPEEVPPPGRVGDATRLFHWRHPSLFKETERPDSSFLVWRSGSTDAAIFVTGAKSAQANDRAAFELALLQQKRIESPSPVFPSEFDSSEVALEDPRLDVPVYWLGRRFTPGRRLPKLRLYDSASTAAPKALAARVNLFYTDHFDLNHAEGVYLDLWSARQWKRLRRRRQPLPGTLRCGGTVRTLELHPGLASIYSGLERTGRGCPARSPRTSYTARIRVGRVVAVAQTTAICAVCASAGTGAYDSRAGMEAIARGLTRRTPPAG
jgi:hypothetical protein